MATSVEQLLKSLAPDKKALLAEYLRPKPEPIAVVGIGCRYPGGINSPEAFWDLLARGGDTIVDVPAERWDGQAFYDPDPDAPGKMHTRWGGFLEDAPMFDAHFFGISPREALRMDPQQRLLLEVAWQALEDAGMAVDQLARSLTGIFIGLIHNDYLVRQLYADGAGCLDDPYFNTGSSSSMASGRMAYLFDLQGPTVTLDTACSSSLVAAHLAVRSLQSGESNLALVGGVNVVVLPDTFINLCKMRMLSSDGRCKTFDAAADGFVMGEGCGVLVLKRLSDALKDGDQVRAVIRGSAVNEDGRSSSLTAPNGQAQELVIRAALAAAGLAPDQISYVEAHGSGTPLGDPIELETLRAVLGKGRAPERPLMVGTVKTNIGHLSAGAGVSGLIKTVLALQHGQIPPHLHFKRLNPSIPRSGAPFMVPTELTPWDTADELRRAGVSSFGWSGTNAHIILEEAPAAPASGPARPWQLLVWSARTAAALDAATDRLHAYLSGHPQVDLADVAATLQNGRKAFAHRRALVCRDVADAIDALERRAANRIAGGQIGESCAVAWMFPGVGDHYAGMARDLYDHEPIFRAAVDRCCAILTPLIGQELIATLYPAEPDQSDLAATPIDFKALLGRSSGATSTAAAPLHQTALAQPAVFVVEYALAQLLLAWGIRPQAMLGYSLGEYVAATVAGVFSLEDALTLVAARARLIQQLPHGAMLAVWLNEADVHTYLSATVNLAAINSPMTCVLAGPRADLETIARQLEAREIGCRWLETSHAFHSAMLAPIADELTTLVRTLTLHPPRIPYLSNVTGDWITAEQATDPAYWTRHMCGTVRFADGVARLLADPQQVLLEVGPGQALGSFARQHPACTRERMGRVLATLPAAHERHSARAAALQALGRLWIASAPIEWAGLIGQEQRRRVALPTYPFERQRYWIDMPEQTARPLVPSQAAGKRGDIAEWFYRPIWEPGALPALAPLPEGRDTWLVFADDTGLGAQLADRLEHTGRQVLLVRQGTHFAQLDRRTFTLNPGARADYGALLGSLAGRLSGKVGIAHLWSVAPVAAGGPEAFRQAQQRGFYSLIWLAQALEQLNLDAEIVVCTSATQSVVGDEPIAPERATVLGPAMVIPQELQGITCRIIDLLPPEPGTPAGRELLDLLLRDLLTSTTGTTAYRYNQRLTLTYAPLRLEATETMLRDGGAYMITGGLGALGLLLAEHLAGSARARLALVGRSGLPERAEWDAWLAEHGADDRTSRRISTVRRLEALGADVLVIAADVASEPELRSAIALAEQRFGALNGVIHAAGVVSASEFRTIRNIDLDSCETHFHPKAHGLYALEQALGDRPLDFCLLFSSLSAVLGGLGFSAYAAANGFMDAFARAHNRSHPTPWISVNWDLWQGSVERDAPAGFAASLMAYSMTPDEGRAAFERVIAARGLPHLVQSTGDLDTRIRQWVRLEAPATDVSSVAHARPELPTAYVPPQGEYEQRIARIWQQVLGLEQVGIHDNFFDLGGNSLVAVQVIAALKQEFQVQLATVALFEAPTVSTLASYVMQKLPNTGAAAAPLRTRQARRSVTSDGDHSIAIIGMAGRFPGASSLEELWQNLCAGRESLTTFSDEALLAAGVSPELIANPDYIKARPVLAQDVALFDAAFFGYTPREAEFMDPQQRLFHECAWEALESAGYDTQRYEGLVGVFAGASLSTYMLERAAHPAFSDFGSDLAAFFANDKDGLTTNVSYKLNLRGPSLAVQTYCSTSLVAVHVACRSLRSGECDMALAGGASIRVPVTSGYLYREGDQVSSDGHCRTFDAQAAGANFGDGVAVVVLKRLADALADGDTIHAVIRGSAINNDGVRKVGYTAPSVVGQAEAVAAALADAALAPETISYVEAHGTATRLGDPVEIASLTKAFRTGTDKVGFCAISSTKPNIGHLDRAAGATGLIKTVLALQHEVIPPTLHFQAPNPEIAFADSPFYVTTALTPWQRNGHPRRAGVNSLGVGGTNAHVIVEEAPAATPSGPSRRQQLLLLSAKTASALEAQTANLAAFLRAHPDLPLADLAYTLHVGRRVFNHRRALVCADVADALDVLERGEARRLLSWTQPPASRAVAFLFAGVGDHYVGMAQELYENEPTFRATVDRCCAILDRELDRDLRQALYPTPLAETPAPAAPTLDFKALLGRTNGAACATGADATPLHQTALAQPAVFVVEYALAQLLAEWGIRPHALLGYSLGEYVAATLAGVLTLEDALTLVAARARLIQQLPHGAMLAVSLSEASVQPYLSASVNLAVINSPLTCVLAGPRPDLELVARRLEQQEIGCRWLATSHAFHSAMLAPIADELTALVRSIPLRPPQIPYLSNVSGDWITAEEATDPTYWARHLCGTVRFADGVARLLADPQQVLLELGPGQALGSFVKQHPSCTREQLGQVLASLRGAHERTSDLAYLLTTLGRLWLLDVPIDWEGFSGREQRRRIPLPTYPFERQRFWIEPGPRMRLAAGDPASIGLMALKREAMPDWFYLPGWRQSAPHLPGAPTPGADAQHCWVLFADDCGIGERIARWLEEQRRTTIVVYPGAAFGQLNDHQYTIDPARRADYDALLGDLHQRGLTPAAIVHLWGVTPALPQPLPDEQLEHLLAHGFYSLLYLAQALGDLNLESCTISVVSSDMQQVTGAEPICPEKATLLGPCKLIQFEYVPLSCRSIDISLPPPDSWEAEDLIAHLIGELTTDVTDHTVALRSNRRWVQTIDHLKLADQPRRGPTLRQGGVYLITGGLGGIGLALAEHLARTVQARLVLVGRSGLPERAAWPDVLASEPPDAPVVSRIRQVQSLEALGSEVLVQRADIADAAATTAAVKQAIAHFGALHGVIHAAGVPGVGLISLKTRAAAESVLAPKLQGTRALARALEHQPLDFLVLFSSIASITGGGAGQVDYCAANAFLEAFANCNATRYGRTVAIGWGEWVWNAWDDAMSGYDAETQALFRERRQLFGIHFDEGAEALERILGHRFPHVFVSTQQLQPFIRLGETAKLNLLQRAERSQHPRPALATSYVMPGTPLEERIAAVWSEQLGIADIGANDNFFELGGNSLIGIDLLARLRKRLNVDHIPSYVLYEAPTVGAMAKFLEPGQRKSTVVQERYDRGAKRRDRMAQLKHGS